MRKEPDPHQPAILGHGSTGKREMHRIVESLIYVALQTGVAAAKVVIRLVPRRLLVAVFRTMADAGFYLSRGFRERSARNLSLALGDQLNAREVSDAVRGSVRNFLRDFLELGFAVESGLDEIRAEIPAGGLEHLRAALAKGKGVIALSAHLGNFLLLGTRLAAEGYPVNVLINQPRSGKIPELRRRYRAKIGQKTIHAHPRDEAFRKLVQALRQNEIAIVIADEFRSGSGIYVPFFGRTVIARRGPATLALRTGAAVVPAYLVRDRTGELQLVIEPELELSRSGKIKADVVANTVTITRWLERTVRSYPEQWNWMTVHWKEEKPPAAVGKAGDQEDAADRSGKMGTINPAEETK
jgi:Kdo2-lipid IVA lauroyltransferase/acyltransferase